MKRTFLALALILVASLPIAAQEKKAPDNVTTHEFRSKVFEVHNRNPRDLANSLQLLGSGFQGSGININEELKTITIRDFPENLATMEEALKRLDRPAAVEPAIELKIAVLIGSKSPGSNSAVPEELAPVVKELNSTLRYSSYTLMTTAVHHTSPGRMIEGSGVVDPAALGVIGDASKVNVKPTIYNYRLQRLSLASTAATPSLAIDDFTFGLRIPIDIGGSTQYQNVGFNTPVTLRSGEKVVIGTTTMGDRALIVVVTANIGK